MVLSSDGSDQRGSAGAVFVRLPAVYGGRCKLARCGNFAGISVPYRASGFTYVIKLSSVFPGSSHGIMCAEFSNQTPRL
jgi:hypothetical protein